MLTPGQCEEELERLWAKLEERTDALAALLDGAAEADVDYRIAYAHNYLEANGTVGERDAQTMLAVEKELIRHKHATAEADACREVVRSLRDQLSAVQSANANVRYQAGLT